MGSQVTGVTQDWWASTSNHNRAHKVGITGSKWEVTGRWGWRAEVTPSNWECIRSWWVRNHLDLGLQG